MSEEKKRWHFRLIHILESIKSIESFCEDVDKDSFLTDEKTYCAVERKLEIIGEAVKHIPDTIKKEFPELEWQKIQSSRNYLAHQYFDIDTEIIWDNVVTELPKLKKVMLQINQKYGIEIKK
jgi:uncharacterized protein with HEPN domain